MKNLQDIEVFPIVTYKHCDIQICKGDDEIPFYYCIVLSKDLLGRSNRENFQCGAWFVEGNDGPDSYSNPYEALISAVNRINRYDDWRQSERQRLTYEAMKE